MKYQGVHITCAYSSRLEIALLFKQGSLSFLAGLWAVSTFMLTSFFLIHGEEPGGDSPLFSCDKGSFSAQHVAYIKPV